MKEMVDNLIQGNRIFLTVLLGEGKTRDHALVDRAVKRYVQLLKIKWRKDNHV